MNIFPCRTDNITAPWLWSMLIVSTSCKSSSFGIASVRAAPSISNDPSGPPPPPHRQSRCAPRGPHLQASCRETRQSGASSVHARTAHRPPPRPPHTRAPTTPHGQSQRRAEAAVAAVPRACLRPPPPGPSRGRPRRARSRTTMRIIASFGSVTVSCVCRGTVK
jgi:hypothetical protein